MTATAFLRWALGLAGGLLALALAIAFLFASPESVAGVLVGGALGVANLAGLGFLGKRLIAVSGPKVLVAVALALKFAVLVALVYLAVRTIPMDIVWFVAGLSLSGIAILGAALYVSVRRFELTT